MALIQQIAVLMEVVVIVVMNALLMVMTFVVRLIPHCAHLGWDRAAVWMKSVFRKIMGMAHAGAQTPKLMWI